MLRLALILSNPPEDSLGMDAQFCCNLSNRQILEDMFGCCLRLWGTSEFSLLHSTRVAGVWGHFARTLSARRRRGVSTRAVTF